LVRQKKNHLKLVLDLLLFITEFRDAPQLDLWSFDHRRYDIGAVAIRESLRQGVRNCVRRLARRNSSLGLLHFDGVLAGI